MSYCLVCMASNRVSPLLHYIYILTVSIVTGTSVVHRKYTESRLTVSSSQCDTFLWTLNSSAVHIIDMTDYDWQP